MGQRQGKHDASVASHTCAARTQESSKQLAECLLPTKIPNIEVSDITGDATCTVVDQIKNYKLQTKTANHKL